MPPNERYKISNSTAYSASMPGMPYMLLIAKHTAIEAAAMKYVTPLNAAIVHRSVCTMYTYVNGCYLSLSVSHHDIEIALN